MSLRRRLALLSAVAVAVTVLVASGLVYALVRDRLLGDVDEDLRNTAQRASILAGGEEFTLQAPENGGNPAIGPGPATEGQGKDVIALPPPGPGGAPILAQVLLPNGEAVPRPGIDVSLPVSGPDRELAESGGEPRFEDVEVQGSPFRVLTQPLADGGAIQVARSLEDTDHTLSTLVLILALVSAGGVALAAALGPVVARTALAPAGEVSDAAEEVARTQDLTRRIEVRGSDELGRLSASFNEMMAALERSESAQRRLVADASHELRTPLATLRTNIETLGRRDQIDPAEREQLVGDLTDELEEMTELVADVVELARLPGQDGGAVREDVALDELARDAVERSRRRARELRFEERISPSLVRGDRQRLGRAISNMLDNACKWSRRRRHGADRGGRRPGGDP